jgi:hypothetical protein
MQAAEQRRDRDRHVEQVPGNAIENAARLEPVRS